MERLIYPILAVVWGAAGAIYMFTTDSDSGTTQGLVCFCISTVCVVLVKLDGYEK